MRQLSGNSLLRATNAGTGTLVSIKDTHLAPRGEELLCPDCKGRVIPSRGSVYRWHFRHFIAGDCCHSISETPLHKSAKAVIAKATEITLPAGGFFGSAHRVAIEKCELEKRDDRVRFDALLHTNKGQIAIEICVTHRVDECKINKLTAIGVPCVEITLSADNEPSDLADEVLQRAPRDWAYEPGATCDPVAGDRFVDTLNKKAQSLAPQASVQHEQECAYKTKKTFHRASGSRSRAELDTKKSSLAYIRCLIVTWEKHLRPCTNYLGRINAERGSAQTSASGVDNYSVARLIAFCEVEIEQLKTLVEYSAGEDLALRASSSLRKMEMMIRRKREFGLPTLETTD